MNKSKDNHAAEDLPVRLRAGSGLVVFSVALLTAVTALWVRSIWRSDIISYTTAENGTSRRWTKQSLWVASTDGVIAFGKRSWDVEVWTDVLIATPQRGLDFRSIPINVRWLYAIGAGSTSVLNRVGFCLGERRSAGPNVRGMKVIETRLDYAVPCWALLLLVAVLPVRWFFMRRRLRLAVVRRTQGQCMRCGYDIRATPGRCPECGEQAGGIAAGSAR